VKSSKPLQEQHSKSNQKIILKNDENAENKLIIKTYKI
jgi:hypothetical protein